VDFKLKLYSQSYTHKNLQESRAISGRTAQCRCKFRYVSNFTIQ